MTKRSSPHHEPIRRICKRCEESYFPTGRYQKLCEDCQPGGKKWKKNK